jgi:hypothetical protein
MSIGRRHDDETNARRDEGTRGALKRKRERWERWELSVEVKNLPLPLSDL